MQEYNNKIAAYLGLSPINIKLCRAIVKGRGEDIRDAICDGASINIYGVNVCEGIANDVCVAILEEFYDSDSTGPSESTILSNMCANKIFSLMRYCMRSDKLVILGELVYHYSSLKKVKKNPMNKFTLQEYIKKSEDFRCAAKMLASYIKFGDIAAIDIFIARGYRIQFLSSFKKRNVYKIWFEDKSSVITVNQAKEESIRYLIINRIINICEYNDRGESVLTSIFVDVLYLKRTPEIILILQDAFDFFSAGGDIVSTTAAAININETAYLSQNLDSNIKNANSDDYAKLVFMIVHSQKKCICLIKNEKMWKILLCHKYLNNKDHAECVQTVINHIMMTDNVGMIRHMIKHKILEEKYITNGLNYCRRKMFDEVPNYIDLLVEADHGYDLALLLSHDCFLRNVNLFKKFVARYDMSEEVLYAVFQQIYAKYKISLIRSGDAVGMRPSCSPCSHCPYNQNIVGVMEYLLSVLHVEFSSRIYAIKDSEASLESIIKLVLFFDIENEHVLEYVRYLFENVSREDIMDVFTFGVHFDVGKNKFVYCVTKRKLLLIFLDCVKHFVDRQFYVDILSNAAKGKRMVNMISTHLLSYLEDSDYDQELFDLTLEINYIFLINYFYSKNPNLSLEKMNMKYYALSEINAAITLLEHSIDNGTPHYDAAFCQQVLSNGCSTVNYEQVMLALKINPDATFSDENIYDVCYGMTKGMHGGAAKLIDLFIARGVFDRDLAIFPQSFKEPTNNIKRTTKNGKRANKGTKRTLASASDLTHADANAGMSERDKSAEQKYLEIIFHKYMQNIAYEKDA